MAQHRDSFRDTFIRNIRIRGFLRCKLYLRSVKKDRMGDWFSAKDAFQLRHGALARVRRARGGLKELGIFFTFMTTLPVESARIPAFVDLCRASFYPDPLCIEVLYLVHYLAHPRLQPMRFPGGKHSARTGWDHFFSTVVVLFECAWMQFFRICLQRPVIT